MIISIVLYGLTVVFLIFILYCSFNIIFSVLSFAPWVPCRGRDLKRIFKLADLKEGQVFYDLGCGDGKLVIYAGNHYKVRAVGLEISLPFYLICQFRKFFNYQANLQFKFKNLFKENLSAADAVYFFGMPKPIKRKLSAKLRQELKSGAKIISYSFKLDDWTPKVIDKPTPKDLPVYLYVV